MAKVLCIATCYMPVKKGGPIVERYEDEYGDMRDLYDIPDNRLEEFLDTGDFQNVVWNAGMKSFEAIEG